MQVTLVSSPDPPPTSVSAAEEGLVKKLGTQNASVLAKSSQNS